ncbi:MAG: hypothetical protein WAV20_25550 [Blastocatellia bacterium]
MGLENWAKLVTIVFQLASSLAVAFAVIKYLRGRDERSGETLLHLENRFKELQSPWEATQSDQLLPSITRTIDPEAHQFEKSELEVAIDLLFNNKWAERSPLQNAWMSRLDELLRFLLLVAAMEKNRLLKRRALWDAYHYWFTAIWETPKLKEYVQQYSSVLYTFLSDNLKEIERYKLSGSIAQKQIGTTGP